MSDFPIYHGITLAENGYIENHVVERLASDPVPVEAARSWYNTTERKYKFSALDETGAIVVLIFATEEQLNSEVLALNTTIGSLTGLTTTDKANVVSAINEVKTQVSNLGNAFNYIGVLYGGETEAKAFDMSTLPTGGKDVGDYYKVGSAGYFVIGSTGTAFYANSNDGLVWNAAGGIDKIDNTDSTIVGVDQFTTVTGSIDTGFTVDINTAFKGRMTTAEQDIDQINSDIGSVASLSTTAKTLVPAINELSGQVNGKIGSTSDLTTTNQTTIVAAINEVNKLVSDLQDEVDTTQIGAGLQSDGTYAPVESTNYLSTATSLVNADVLLDTQIKAIRDNYAANRFVYHSTSAATQHTVTHGLSSQFVDFTVWVQRADGTWRNDVAAVKATSENALDVFLTVASNIHVSCASHAVI